MPAGYAATTNMESAMATGFQFTAELSDLRIIELPAGTSRPPSNIIHARNPFQLYTDIHFVGAPSPLPPLPDVAVDVEWFVEGYGGPAASAEAQTGLIPGVYVGPALPPNTHPLQFPVGAAGVILPDDGIYKVAAAVRVRWAEDPAAPNSYFMWGFIEGAPLQVFA